MPTPFLNDPFKEKSFGGKLFDKLLSYTGAIGARIRGYQLEAFRDEVYMTQPKHKPKRTKLVDSDGRSLVFDCTTDINPVFPTKVTSFPVEDKADISDHVINQNPTFSLTAIVSDAGAPTNPEKDAKTQQDFYDSILRIRDKRKTISLITPNNTYTDLILTSVGFPRKSGDGISLYIDMQLEKIRKVSAELTTVFVTSRGNSTGTNSGKVKQTGDVATKNTPEADKGSVSTKDAKQSEVGGILKILRTLDPELSKTVEEAVPAQ